MIAELSAAMTAIKETAGLVKVINDSKTDVEIKAATIDLQNKLITLQAECFSLGEVIRVRDEQVEHLKGKIAEYEDFEIKTDGYILKQLDSGTLVYAKEQIIGGVKITVHLCPQCYSKKVVSMLQPTCETFYDPHTDTYFYQNRCNCCSSLYSMNKSDYKPEDFVYV